ncbi:type 1 glutamine amidotransferase domain-containing protein [Kitasatospora kifunensis]|uniref:type 1 glutamine amidotransferase domain-containing protein n=1 Tax=Kitasatospora kifunensis TaxID=58351 RepID=UPI0016101F6B|nr:type 1 glutamine amidotransferase domain-containing protein [Kitasatospora kifunensis]
MTIAFLTAPEGVEQVELTEPWQAVLEAGGTPRLLSTRTGRVQAYRHLERADTFGVDAVVPAAGESEGAGKGEGDGGAEARDGDVYDALVLPGGVANPDVLRVEPGAVTLVRSFFAAGKPVAAICHAPWLLIEADVVRGRTLTSWPSLRTDLLNAGAHWVDEEVRLCTAGPNVLITSRKPDDLPLFNDALVTQFAKARR